MTDPCITGNPVVIQSDDDLLDLLGNPIDAPLLGGEARQ